MEDILASIKKVIAEDGGPAQPRGGRGSRSAETGRAAPFPAEEDVLELHDPVSEGNGLVSQDATAASRQALAALATIRERGEEEGPADDAVLGAAVREMLKPMLKEWLDRHLPEMVEELVTREIARITGKSL